MQYEVARLVRVTVVDVVVEITAACDEGSLPFNPDAVGSGSFRFDPQVTTGRGWSLKQKGADLIDGVG